MRSRRLVVVGLSVLALVPAVAACSGGSDRQGTPSVTATTTVTGSASGVPATGSVPATPPPTTGSTPATSAGGSNSANPSGAGLCTPTVMTFRLGAGQGAAGTGYQPIVATNASQQPCVTTGFPGVAMLDAAGRQIAQASRSTGARTPVTIVVQPGQQVSALLSSSNGGSGGAGCPTAPALLLTLPDNTDSTRIVAGLAACPDGVSVGPLVPGTTGR